MVHFYVVTEANHQLGKHDVELASARIATTLHPDSRDLVGMALRATAALGDIRTLDSLLTSIEAMPPSPNGRPLASWLLTAAGELAYHGHRADAERIIRRAAEWQRTHPIESTPFWNASFELARTFYFLGAYRDAGRLLDSLIAREPQNPFYLAYAAASEARVGNATTAAVLRNRLDALNRPFDHGETPYARALVAAELGDSSSAVTLLRHSLERGMPPDHFSIHADLMLSRLRGNAEFEQLLRPKD
jgi:tetratricopeptide (TPR) repeat protein